MQKFRGDESSTLYDDIILRIVRKQGRILVKTRIYQERRKALVWRGGIKTGRYYIHGRGPICPADSKTHMGDQ